jgi:polyhydroxyalkanoate synthase
VFCLDWGVPEDEDRHLGWDDVLGRLFRAMRRVRRISRSPRIGLLGYCMGGTLAAIASALEPNSVSALVNLLGPIDFSKGGILREMVDPRWFDGRAVADAGNVAAHQMQAGFVAMRPTGTAAKWVGFLDRAHDPAAVEAFMALETWASDNVAFPAEAYATYIRELYQENRLLAGTHAVLGRRVDLGSITAPVLTVVADRDAICPPEAAIALRSSEILRVPGGHVGAVIGARAQKELYPAIARFFTSKLSPSSVS